MVTLQCIILFKLMYNIINLVSRTNKNIQWFHMGFIPQNDQTLIKYDILNPLI